MENEKIDVYVNMKHDIVDEHKKLAKQFSDLDIKWGIYFETITVSMTPTQITEFKRFFGRYMEICREKNSSPHIMSEYEHAVNISVPGNPELEKVARELGSEIDGIFSRLREGLPMDIVAMNISEKLMIKITEYVKKHPEYEHENDYVEKLIIKHINNK